MNERRVGELVSALAHAVEMARGQKITSRPQARILDPVKKALAAVAERDDGVQIERARDGLIIGSELLDTASPAVQVVFRQCLNLGVQGLYLPSWIQPPHLWRFLVIFGIDSNQILDAGGLELCLEQAGCSAIRVHEEPPDVLEVTTAGYRPLPGLEEVDARLQERRSGDTVESLPFDRPKSPDEVARLYGQVTREVVRAFRPDGADSAARALLLAWRRIAVVRTKNAQAEIDVHRVVAVVQRLEPLIRFAILAQLAYTSDGKSIGALLPDGQLADSVRTAILWGYADAQAAAVAVLRTARTDHADRAIVVKLIQAQMDNVAVERSRVWDAISEAATKGDA